MFYSSKIYKLKAMKMHVQCTLYNIWISSVKQRHIINSKRGHRLFILQIKLNSNNYSFANQF